MSYRDKKYLIFDMDGTLIDSSSVISNSINFVRKHLSLEPMRKEHIISCINSVNIHAPSFFYGVDEFQKDHIELFKEYYSKNHHIDTALYDGIERLLELLKRDNRSLSVATNAYKLSAKEILDAKGISSYFDIVVSADEVKNPKPSREMIDKIVEFYRAELDEFVVIGDGERDIMAAKSAGVDYIVVDWGFSNHKDAVRSVKRLEELLLTS